MITTVTEPVKGVLVWIAVGSLCILGSVLYTMTTKKASLSSINWFFFASCYGCRATSEYRVGAVAWSFATTKCLTLMCVNECITTLSLTVFTQRNFVADFLQEKCNFTPKTAVLRFSATPPPLWGLGTTYDVHLRLIGKRVVDSLLVLIELFSRCYGWGATAKIDWKSAFCKGWISICQIFTWKGTCLTSHFRTYR